ncbi:unnamed protein product [Didymodactylos carnosus]|uniref:Thioredoxin domain-containing protein n=1 Tax=Didymodactylos carnosus TaxID=1234261 RepID=A0A815GB49_9BILA|nr:unnamed protein product [Didymodactylos carnosus]CAF1401737.1 unnamed protein product [Didymodactylos carnosus]CAF4193646.1 unnamed protein product [Didymodactylos carnosus]CAF4208888.1 unnamed protein product [Didymodactylos carnosus]
MGTCSSSHDEERLPFNSPSRAKSGDRSVVYRSLATMIAPVHDITTLAQLDFYNNKNEGHLVVLDCHAKWCPPCIKIEPIINEWAQSAEYCDTVVFLKCDVDQGEELQHKYKVESLPTFIYFKHGKEIHRLVGANVRRLKQDIDIFR